MITNRVHVPPHAAPIRQDQHPHSLEHQQGQRRPPQECGQFGDLHLDAFLLLVRNVNHGMVLLSIEAGGVAFGCIIMDISSSSLRRTSYFEKYRKELERISEEMRNKNQSSSFSEKSSKDPPTHPTHPHAYTNLSVTQSQHTPSTQSQNTMAFHPVHQPPIPPLLKSSKKSPVFEAQREPVRVQGRAQGREEAEREGEEEGREAQLLMGEVEAAREKLLRCEEDICLRRTALESLRRQLSGHVSSGSSGELQGYAEKMLAIETRMKFKKELHEDELNCLVNDRNQRHAENVQLSKLIESLEEELQTLASEDRRDQQSSALMQTQALKLQGEIGRVAQECAQVELRINNSQQLRQLSGSEYRRYSEVFRRELVGREVAQCEERIRDRNNQKRYHVEVERRKVLVRERKVENGVRQKALVELTRVIDFVGKEVAALKKEMATLSDKTAFFGK